MVSDPLETLDLSDLSDYDADQEYRALLRALRRQAGFGIIFVRCSPDQGHKLTADLKQDLPRKHCEVLTFTDPLPDGDFFSQATAFWAEHPADVVFVQGIEHSLLDYEESKRQSGWTAAESRGYSWKAVPPLLRNLNQQRDRFRNRLPACFVFLVPLFLVKYLKRRAPDFFDWRSGVFEFKDTQAVIARKIKECAVEDFEKFLELSPSERRTQQINLKDLLEEPSIASDERFRLLFNLGILQTIDSTFENAWIHWHKALVLSVSTAENLTHKGHLLAAQNLHEEAISSYDQALEIKPDYHEAWYNRGISLKNLGRYEEAISSYDQALKIKPDYHEAWNNRGISLKN
ncbi:MAG: tetratricopeptide repeat protein, partial [Cyanobacteria bacterium P01_F01_bin.86]